MSEYINNKSHRIQQLKTIIQGLHEGVAPEIVKDQLKTLVKETDATEIAAMEQELIAGGLPVVQIQAMCDMHSQVVREILANPKEHHVAPGHPVDTFRQENQALQQAAMRMSTAVADAVSPDEEKAQEALIQARAALNDLMEVDKHYQRKENLLFPFLEKYGITGPSKVMWAKDDEVRGFLKQLEAALRGAIENPAQRNEIVPIAQRAVMALEEMIQKEERILLPMSLETLTEEDWGEVWQQSPDIGWCLVEPREGYQLPESQQPLPEARIDDAHSIALPTGSLTLEQLKGLFANLPVDITFVDADDRVRYFSQGPERIFGRSRAILGRKVQHCHPPKSVDIVERILDDFKSGAQSVAEFWLNFQGMFVHVRYFAVRDEAGKYIGTLEVTQDLTRLRALEGERRLLEYDSPAKLN